MDKSDNLFSSCGSGCDRLSPWTQMDWNKFATFSTTSTSPGGCKLVCWSVGRVELWANHRPMMIFVIICLWWLYYIQGSCTGVEFKASLEKSLNYIKLKKSLNCFGKQAEGLETLEFAYAKLSTRIGDLVTENFLPQNWELPALDRLLLINVMHECFKSVCFSQVPVGLYAVEWSTGRRPWIGLELLSEKATKSLEFL